MKKNVDTGRWYTCINKDCPKKKLPISDKCFDKGADIFLADCVFCRAPNQFKFFDGMGKCNIDEAERYFAPVRLPWGVFWESELSDQSE